MGSGCCSSDHASPDADIEQTEQLNPSQNEHKAAYLDDAVIETKEECCRNADQCAPSTDIERTEPFIPSQDDVKNRGLDDAIVAMIETKETIKKFNEWFSDSNDAVTINATGDIVIIDANNPKYEDKYNGGQRLALGSTLLDKNKENVIYEWKIKIIQSSGKAIKIGLTDLSTSYYSLLQELNLFDSSGWCRYMTEKSMGSSGVSSPAKGYPKGFETGDIVTVKVNTKYWNIQFFRNDEAVDDTNALHGNKLRFTIASTSGGDVSSNTVLRLIEFKKEELDSVLVHGYSEEHIDILWDEVSLSYQQRGAVVCVAISANINKDKKRWGKETDKEGWGEGVGEWNQFFKTMIKAKESKSIRCYVHKDDVEKDLFVHINGVNNSTLKFFLPKCNGN